MFQSIFACRHQYDISKLLEKHTKIDSFLKSFPEFDKSNFINILAFDSKSIAVLLGKNHQNCFNKEYPIIYKLTEAR